MKLEAKYVLARSRKHSTDKVTLGVLFDPALQELCKTVELPWKDNQKFVSCILEGEYTVVLHDSPKFGLCFWIQGVPGRTGILFHVANFVRELLGCIAPGFIHKDIDHDGIIDVQDSRAALDHLLAVLPKRFTLVVKWT